jgi:hypothetical protein
MYKIAMLNSVWTLKNNQKNPAAFGNYEPITAGTLTRWLFLSI